MPRTVKYNGIEHQFPDDATDDEVRSALEASDRPIDYSKSTEPSNLQKLGTMAKDFTAGVGSGVISTGVGAYKLARKVPGVPQILPKPNEYVEGLTKPPDSTAGAVGHGAEQFGEYLLPGGIVRRGAKALQVGGRIGPVANALSHAGLQVGADTAVTAAQTGGDSEAMKTAAETSGIANTAIGVPMAIARTAPRVNKALNNLGTRLYQSAIKIPPSFDREDRMAAVEQGLHDKIPVDEGGYLKNKANLKKDTEVVNTKLKEATDQGKIVEPEAVAAYTGEPRADFANQVNPGSDVNAIDASKQEFLKKHSYEAPYTEVRPATEFEGYVPTGEGSTQVSKPMTVSEAHSEKQGTYRVLRKKYGELSGAATESQKNLARGLKEEIYKQVPGLREIGEHQKIGIDLDEALERFVNREGNKQILGLEAPVAMAGAHALGAGGGPVAAAGLVTQFFDRFPALKSRVAIALANRGQDAGAVVSKARLVKRLSVPAALAMYGNNQQQ